MNHSDDEDSRFYKTFKMLMNEMGVPCPESLFSRTATALATTLQC